MSSSSWGCAYVVNARAKHTRARHLLAKASSDVEADDDSEDTNLSPGKPLRVERLLSNLGYGKRKECTSMIKRKQLVYTDTGRPAKVGEKALASQVLLDGAPLDPAPPLTLLLHKPVGFVVTSPSDEMISDPKVYDLLPHRFGYRRPFLSAVGRLDKDTSGLLLLTDDGQLLHSIQSPAKGIWKRYTAKLAAPLTGKDAAKAIQRFASGQLQLQGDRTPLLPAALHMLDDTTAEVCLCEGRYHQIRRMFAALGHTVVELHRHTIGGLSLLQEPYLALGSWRLATQADIDAVLSGPDSFAAVQKQQQQQASSPADGAAASPLGMGSPASSSSSSEGNSDPTPVQEGYEDGIYGLSSSRREVSAAAAADVVAEDDVDHPGEPAAAAKRFRNTSKQARRRAALLNSVKTMRMQQQHTDNQGEPLNG